MKISRKKTKRSCLILMMSLAILGKAHAQSLDSLRTSMEAAQSRYETLNAATADAQSSVDSATEAVTAAGTAVSDARTVQTAAQARVATATSAARTATTALTNARINYTNAQKALASRVSAAAAAQALQIRLAAAFQASGAALQKATTAAGLASDTKDQRELVVSEAVKTLESRKAALDINPKNQTLLASHRSAVAALSSARTALTAANLALTRANAAVTSAMNARNQAETNRNNADTALATANNLRTSAQSDLAPLLEALTVATANSQAAASELSSANQAMRNAAATLATALRQLTTLTATLRTATRNLQLNKARSDAALKVFESARSKYLQALALLKDPDNLQVLSFQRVIELVIPKVSGWSTLEEGPSFFFIPVGSTKNYQKIRCGFAPTLYSKEMTADSLEEVPLMQHPQNQKLGNGYLFKIPSPQRGFENDLHTLRCAASTPEGDVPIDSIIKMERNLARRSLSSTGFANNNPCGYSSDGVTANAMFTLAGPLLGFPSEPFASDTRTHQPYRITFNTPSGTTLPVDDKYSSRKDLYRNSDNTLIAIIRSSANPIYGCGLTPRRLLIRKDTSTGFVWLKSLVNSYASFGITSNFGTSGQFVHNSNTRVPLGVVVNAQGKAVLFHRNSAGKLIPGAVIQNATGYLKAMFQESNVSLPEIPFEKALSAAENGGEETPSEEIVGVTESLVGSKAASKGK